MQKFRQHNKIFAQTCILSKNAVKYSLTKKRQTLVMGKAVSSALRRTALLKRGN